MSASTLFYGLVVLWPASELWIGARHRAGGGDATRDRGTLRLLLVAIYASVALAVWLSIRSVWPFPQTLRAPLFFGGCAAMALGIALRLWSVRTLARFFTIQVAIRDGHRLIRTGPYRLLRHPSYTGSLMTFLGFGCALGSGAALLAVGVPVTLAFLRRIRVEERVLADAFPADYPDYARTTWRLLPFVW
jgi:protein-S-isoprenylcysteine O-methyltransferase